MKAALKKFGGTMATRASERLIELAVTKLLDVTFDAVATYIEKFKATSPKS